MHNLKIFGMAKCVMNSARENVLTEGKLYMIRDAHEGAVCVEADNDEHIWFIPDRFEPVTAVALGPQQIANEQVYMYDVDDTLVVWDDDFLRPDGGRVRIVDPYDKNAVYLKPHVRHVKLLKQMHGRGRFIIVWSQSGVQWANAVVEALGLKDHVGLVMTKPSGYVDDLPSDKWMQNRIYLEQGDDT